jgi:CheY-like chemotaxis protein
MHPCYHKSSVLVLDDDPLFLESFDFQFGSELNCRTFTHPDAAIEHLALTPNWRATLEQCIAGQSAETDPADPTRKFTVSISPLRTTFDNDLRFDCVSVAIVDYDMPRMNGVQFCRNIRHTGVKTLLLTGKAGLETAVNAFNEGMIDCFLQKQDPQISNTMRTEIARLQQLYFRDVLGPVRAVLTADSRHFLCDPAVVRFLEQQLEQAKAGEYCISEQPLGVVVRNDNGAESFILLSDIDDAMACAQRVAQRGAAPELVDHLTNGHVAGRGSGWDKGVTDIDPKTWSMFAASAQRVPGSKRWLYSLWDAKLTSIAKARGAFPGGAEA